MITGKGTTLIFSEGLRKPLSISKTFSLNVAPDRREPHWKEKVEQNILQLTKRIADLEETLEKQKVSLPEKKIRAKGNEADVKVTRSVCFNLKQCNAGTQFKNCSSGSKEFCHFPPYQKSMKRAHGNKRFECISENIELPLSCLQGPWSDGLPGSPRLERIGPEPGFSYVNYPPILVPRNASYCGCNARRFSYPSFSALS